MYKTTIVGFPRFGKNREFKNFTEQFFKNELNENEYLDKLENLQRENISIMKEHIDIIPVNDFSLYDNMLDMMWALGAVEKEYLENNLSYIEKYFTIARGIKKGKLNLKSYDMKKWFDTNYHYIVPKINEKLSLKTDFYFINRNIKIAKKITNDYKVNIIGLFTFLKLSHWDKFNKKVFEKLLDNYLELLKNLTNLNVEIIQIEEPYLCMDFNKKDYDLFENIYKAILKDKIILQTYFSYLDERYLKKLYMMNFDGIGLDFVSGFRNIDIIKKVGFDSQKKLIIGCVNGKNIWVSEYKKIINLVKDLTNIVPKKNLLLSSSCSLLHVPYAKDNENKIDKKIFSLLSFAVEKLKELQELKEILLDEENYFKNSKFKKNQKIIFSGKKSLSAKKEKLICELISKISYKDLKRSNYQKRRKIQEKILQLPILPTTTIGSFPQTQDLRKIRKKYKEGKVSKIEYEKFIKEKIKEAIEFQEKLNIDILVHGEFERNDMVEYFAENLNGFVITQNGWVQSYGTRGVKPPIIIDYINRPKSITVDYIKYAQGLTSKYVKAILTGPITIINWSFVNEKLDFKKLCFSISIALQKEIDELVKNNIKIIQIDEAALREKLPLKEKERKEYIENAVDAFRYAVKNAPDYIQIHSHMCYSEFKDIIKYIDKMDIDVLSIEAAKSDLKILNFIKNYAKKKQIGPGVYDIHSSRIPEVKELEEKIKQILKVVPIKNLWINPDCGLKTRKWEEVKLSLINMVKAKDKIKKHRNI